MGNTKYLVSFTDADHNATRVIVTAECALQAVACTAVDVSSGPHGSCFGLNRHNVRCVDVSQRTVTGEEY